VIPSNFRRRGLWEYTPDFIQSERLLKHQLIKFKLKTQSKMANLRVPIPDETGYLVMTWFSEFLKSYKYDGDSEALTAQQMCVLLLAYNLST